MAAVLRSGRVVRITQTLGALQSHRSYHKKRKGRLKDRKTPEIDVNEILARNTAKTTNARTTDGINMAAVPTAEKAGGDSWQHSQERLGLLRKGEKRVAAIAVVTMILAFGAMKFMLPGKQKKELQETTGT